MSMENAILELAAAMREQAAAQRLALEGAARMWASEGADREARTAYYRRMVAGAIMPAAAQEREADSSQVDESMSKPSAPAADVETLEKREFKREEVPAIVESDAELDEAVAEIEQRALDYKNDVRPVLLQVAKKDKTKLTALLAKYDAKDGPSLSDKHYGAIMADANEYLAA